MYTPILCAVIVASFGVSADPAAHASLETLFKDYWEAQLRNAPLRATYLGDHRYDDKLEDFSDAAHARWMAERMGFQRRLGPLLGATLSPEERLNAELFERVLRDQIEMDSFPDRLMPMEQQNGPHIDLGLLLLSHPFQTAKDYENYLSRLEAFAVQADQIIALLREGVRQNVVPPRVLMQSVIEQLARQIVPKPEESQFYKPVTQFPAGISADRQAELRKAVARVIAEKVLPAFKRLHDYLRDDYMPRCRTQVGLCHLGNGKVWYQRLAKYHTTTDLPPEEIHQIGMRELERIHNEMRGVMKKVGFNGTLAQFAEHLRGHSDLHARTADDLMKGHAAILARSDPLLPKLFGRLPKAPYELKEIETFRAPEAPMAYYYQAPDRGDRPAYFYVNVYEPTKRPLYTMESLAYHEAMPGHHLQVSVAQENQGIPDFRRHTQFTGFVEGWGLYSESLGFDLGGYRDPYSDYGRMTFDAWRSCRLVVDTGMHWFGWSRERAIDFMKSNTSMTELDIIKEVDRYIARPGQALAYKIGQLEILSLRREAEKKLGSRFDIRAFHDELLGAGAIPLDLLRTRMTAWMERAARS